MKKLLTICLGLFLFIGVYAQEKTEQEKSTKYEINGTFTGVYKGKVYLVEEDGMHGPQTVIDSCLVVDNAFTFKGEAPQYSVIHFVKSEDGQIAPVFLEPGKINMRLRPDFFLGANSRGTVNNNLWGLHEHYVNFVRDSVQLATGTDWMRKGRGSDEFEDSEFKRRTSLINNTKLEMEKRMVDYYNKEAFAPFIILFEMSLEVSLQELKAMRAKLDPSLNDHPYTKALDLVIIQKDFKVGAEAPAFSIIDINGKEIELKNYAGKYVLIDFWASWCGPCRREMPNVVKLYEEYKGDNFEIIGISLDLEEDDWKKAITDMNMTWPQACDFLMWNSPVARKYNVVNVPSMVLINPEGKVEAIDLRGKQLHAKIEELLTK